MDTKVFRSMSYGVYVVGSMDGDRPVGCIANSIMQITSSPATVAVSLNHDNYTNGCVAKSGIFSFSILGQKSDPGLIGGFGFRSGRDADKFEGVAYRMVSGCPVIEDSCGYVVCRVIDRMETATHTVFLGEVVDGAVSPAQEEPMTYAYYHQVIKGKSPKNAPTYLPEEETVQSEEKQEGRAVWVCQICGYVYEGDPLPEGFQCPVCRQDASHFKREVR